MKVADTQLDARATRIAAIVGIAAILALIALMSRWVGPNAAPATFDAFFTLASSLPIPLAWLCSAIGLGWPLRRILARETAHPAALQVALGIAAMLFLDASLGSLGILTNQLAAWAIIAFGIALLLVQLSKQRNLSLDDMLPPPLAWASAPAIAVLLLAACSAPGWLWSSEFGGYDALSYHLQLPKEWLASGSISPLDHNVYSFLPGYFEAAYLHLMSMRGAAHFPVALYDCQMLHALLTIASAAMVGTLAKRFVGSALGAFAAAIYLATPWTIIVGSLAYNEMAVNLMVTAGLLIVFDDPLSAARRGMLIGIVSAAATGAKLTSLGFIAVPLAIALLTQTPARKWMPMLALASLAGVIGLAPYLLRNWIHAGNLLFPFATDVFGAAHWSTEQVHTWHRGHMPDASIPQRFTALWHQFFAYGFGANPKPAEPWQPQWNILPWLGIIGGAAALVRASLHRPAAALFMALLAQIIFWLAATHLQSRFLIPCAVPLSVLTTMGVHALIRRTSSSPTLAASRRTSITLAVAAFVLSLLPVRIFMQEGNNAPALAIGTASQQTGDALTDAERRELGSTIYPAIAVNWLLPPGSKVLLVGESAPLYYRLDRVVYNTVWDRSPLAAIMRDNDNDPELMRQALRDLGYTHVLVNPTMLTIWERDGWNDPLITRRSVQQFLESAAEPIFDYPRPSEITIYALPN